jgi:hypothetical protein
MPQKAAPLAGGWRFCHGGHKRSFAFDSWMRGAHRRQTFFDKILEASYEVRRSGFHRCPRKSQPKSSKPTAASQLPRTRSIIRPFPTPKIAAPAEPKMITTSADVAIPKSSLVPAFARPNACPLRYPCSSPMAAAISAILRRVPGLIGGYFWSEARWSAKIFPAGNRTQKY